MTQREVAMQRLDQVQHEANEGSEMFDTEVQGLREEGSDRDVQPKGWKLIRTWFVPLSAQWIWAVLLYFCFQIVQDVVPPRYTPPPPLPDPSLSFPNQETCSGNCLFYLSFIIPLFFIAMFSFFFDKAALGVNVLALLQSYSNGQMFMTVLKKLTGKPRPCFYDLCKWDWEERACTASTKAIWSAHQAFPSGHALLSFAGLGFLGVFIVTRVPQLATRPLSPCQLQGVQVCALLPLLLAAWVAVSRIFDHKHDGSDVTAGALLGMACVWIGHWHMKANRTALVEQITGVGPSRGG